jgi:hypothetical protein
MCLELLSKIINCRDHHHHHHIAIKELGHLLARSGLTHPEVSSVVFFGYSFLGCSFFLSTWVICYVEFDLHVVKLQRCVN